jgi:peptidyl-prolyl cis-trans isomerase D
MLQQMREASRGWIAAGLMGLLVISFAIWGIGDIFRVGATTAVAEVGSEEINVERLKRDITRFMNQIRERTGQSITPAEIKDRGLDRALLNTLVEQTIITTKLRELGLSISDDQIRNEIHAQFQAAGQFDRLSFNNFLNQAGYSEGEFIETVRAAMLRGQLQNVLHAGPSVPPGYLATLISHQNERRIAEYIVITPDKAGEIPDPGDEALQAYVKANEGNFTAPEYRAVSYVAVTPEDLMPTVNISEDQIRSVYEQRKERFSTPEKRVLEQIQFTTKEAAEAAKKKVDAGTPFATIAVEAGFKPEDIALGELPKGDTSVPAEAFEIPAGTISAPLQGPFGWVLIRAVSVTPGTEKSFESVRQEIRDAMARQEAVELVREESNKIEDALGAGMTLEEIATETKYPLRKIEAIDLSGKDPTGKAAEGLGADAAFLNAAFDQNRGTGEQSELIPATDDGYFVVRVDSITPSTVRPFAEIRADVLKAYQAEERSKKLAAMGEELVKRGNGGTTFDTLAGELGAKIQSSDPVARATRTAQFAEEVVDKLYAVKPDTFVSGAVGEGDGYVVAKLVDVAVVKTDKPEERKAFADAIQRRNVTDLEKQFTEATRQELGVTINEDVFKTVQPSDT